eukprot:15443416-Alexandrium_andersonii.AAC.1
MLSCTSGESMCALQTETSVGAALPRPSVELHVWRFDVRSAGRSIASTIGGGASCRVRIRTDRACDRCVQLVSTQQARAERALRL